MGILLGPLFTIIDAAIGLYLWVVIASAVLSWLVAFNVINTRNPVVYTIGETLHRLTDPPLYQIRRIIPLLGGVDISPVVLIFALQFLRMVVDGLAFRLLRGGF